MDNHRNCHVLLRVDDADGQALFPSLPTNALQVGSPKEDEMSWQGFVDRV